MSSDAASSGLSLTFEAFGEPEAVLELKTLPVKEPAEGEVTVKWLLVRSHACDAWMHMQLSVEA
jgi:NADPH:quinone reductase-like Zn-dependent oxidoreductase